MAWPPFVDMDVLDRNFLCALAAMAVEGFEQRRECPLGALCGAYFG
jgi:hypothetical protein